MAKRQRRILPAAVALAMLSLAAPSRADWKFTPMVDLRETYTDNVALRAVGQANWVSEIAPGFILEDSSPRLQLKATYSKHFFEYSDKDIGGTNGNQQQLTADAKAKLVNDLLFLDASANISQRAASAFGPLLFNNAGGIGAGNGFASANSNEVKTFRLSPYLMNRFGSYATGELRYAQDRVSSNASGLGDTNGGTTSLNVNSGTAFHTLGWNVVATHADLTSTVAGKSRNDNMNVGLRYLVIPTFTATTSVGYDSYDYAALGGKTGGKAWSVGFRWEPSTRTSVVATVGKRYYGNSYHLQSLHRTRASVWTLNYSDEVTTTRAQFLLPSTVNTATLLDGLFTSSIPDPVARRQAVDAYILATGLPASLANSINYFSNRYILQKQLQAAAAFNGAHSTLIVTLTDARRQALSAATVDSGLLGSSTSALNENTRQDSITGILNWRLNTRTSANLSADYTRVTSVTQNRTDNHSSLRMILTHELQSQLSGNLEVRRLRGGVSPASYIENAIAVAITKKF